MRVLVLMMIVLFSSCANEKEITTDNSSSNKREMGASKDGSVSCQLIEKNFVGKNGVDTDVKELYLRCSVQDYFIKLCESNVSRADLEAYLDKGITVIMEIKEGEWDHCGEEYEIQSRTGTYCVITSIVTN